MPRLEEKINGIVYKATSPSGKIYIGITQQSFRTRKLEHLRKTKASSKMAFHCAIRKYGEKNINWEIIAKADNWNKLEELEIKFIKKFDTYKNGYNMTLGGDGTIGYKHSTEWVLANKERKKSYYKNPKKQRKPI